MPDSALAPDDAMRRVFRYLSETDALEAAPYDAVIGFGMFDLSLPRVCGDLYVRGQARHIIFTGGIGAGTGDLGGPEADVWRRTLRDTHPSIPDEAVIVENRSTNTGENVTFTAARLEHWRPELAFGRGLRRVVIVASPTRLRRVWLTFRRQQPEVRVTRHLPPVTVEHDAALYAGQGIDYRQHLAGELGRIRAYPARGWIFDEPLPVDVAAAHDMLRAPSWEAAEE
jgi:uncharacterized SAM-binding protein YcdF (DUF218 family)